MADVEQKPLAEVLFGTHPEEASKPAEDLAQAINAWFRAGRSKGSEGGCHGITSGDASKTSRRPQ
jgi:hypothetical protein